MTDAGAKMIADAIMELARQKKIHNLVEHGHRYVVDYIDAKNSHGDPIKVCDKKQEDNYMKLVRSLFSKDLGEF